MTDPRPADTPNDAADPKKLNFYITSAHPCNYLPGRQASSLIADLRVRITTPIYAALINHGFRRSGDYVYRPHCQACDACVPVRVPVALFQPQRSQKRTWRRNQDLHVRRVECAYHAEHFLLYQRYVRSRHNGTGMDQCGPDHYMEFIGSAGIDTVLYEFRHGDALLAVAVVDQLPQGLSAVYTFYEADDAQLAKRSLGTFGVLRLIEECRTRDLPWLYLGYWIANSEKMAYKNRFQPLHAYREGHWGRLPPDGAAAGDKA